MKKGWLVLLLLPAGLVALVVAAMLFVLAEAALTMRSSVSPEQEAHILAEVDLDRLLAVPVAPAAFTDGEGTLMRISFAERSRVAADWQVNHNVAHWPYARSDRFPESVMDGHFEAMAKAAPGSTKVVLAEDEQLRAYRFEADGELVGLIVVYSEPTMQSQLVTSAKAGVFAEDAEAVAMEIGLRGLGAWGL